ALSKGRILDDSLPLLAQAGIVPLEDPRTSRRLVFDTSLAHVQLVLIRATDVPTYVRYGAADLGFSGKDVLMEQSDLDLYELFDLGIARCRLVVAEPQAAANGTRGLRPRVATKYPNITRQFFADRGLQAEIVKLYGSMELAPLVGLADQIVDLVSTGKTLAANGLVEVEQIAPVSTWLVANKAAMKLKHAALTAITQRLQEVVA
ncbi:MAG TPA: ATP phosphoribosyltransferase, partial [Acidiferrobacteraceae bacterium]|nr:ATP phosphoribosyltransferase [Acidiferrobacteraceae bacterium]